MHSHPVRNISSYIHHRNYMMDISTKYQPTDTHVYTYCDDDFIYFYFIHAYTILAHTENANEIE